MTTFKLISTILWFTFLGGKESNLTELVYQVAIDENTRVVINGTTNINAFSCAYQSKYNNDNFCIYGNMTGNTMTLINAVFSLEVNSFDCGNMIMTSDFKKTLKEDSFPKITMEITSIDFVKEENLLSQKSDVYAQINVNAAGQNRSYCVKSRRTLILEGVQFNGDFDIEVADFGIEPPSHAFGLIEVNPTMSIEYSFVFNASKS